MSKPRICADCKNSYTLPKSAKYRRCDKSEADEGSDGTLCGVMRSADGACGPDATLFEVRDGQA
jgi:hypothetical protein